MNMEISPQDLSNKLKAKEDLFLLDVRTPEEYAFCSLGGKNLPLGDLPLLWEQVPTDKEVITICHHGVRSLKAAAFLKEKGFEKVKSLKGGIDLWSEQIDPSVPRY